MPNIEMLTDLISQHRTDAQNDQQAYFSTIDLKYACSQLQLHKDTAKHCNIKIICGESRAEFQKAMDFPLVRL